MRTSTVILVVLVTLLIPQIAEAKYRPLTWQDLLGKSDLVVRGEIVTLRDGDFDLKIEAIVAGRFVGKQITVQRFRNWPCASRWAPYATGQKVLLCLEHKAMKAGTPKVYRIRSGGGEGEMPIVNGQVLLRGRGVVAEKFEVHGGRLRAQKVPLAKLRELVERVRGASGSTAR